MRNETFLNIQEGERKREDIFLPILYYPTVDPLNENSWIKDLGPKTFVAWLQLLTLVDRRKTALDVYGNQNTVPRSLEGLAKVLGMSRPTLYKVVIKPLWNYGFIDLVEWTDQKKIGTKAINIIVYPYPQNDKTLENKSLIKVRDYDTEYSSDAKTFSLKAAELRSKESQFETNENDQVTNRKENFTVEGKDFFTVESDNDSINNADKSNRKENFTVKGKDPFTLTVNETLPNNISNTQVNMSNANINNSNTFKENKRDEEDEYIYSNIYEEDDVFIEGAGEHLLNLGIPVDLVEKIKEELLAAPKFSFKLEDLDKQLENMKNDYNSGKQIYSFEKYFVNGLLQLANKYALEQINFPSQQISVKKVPFYNWLEERD